MKVVVAGGGSVGRFTAEQLVAAGHEVTIIENDRSVVAEYAENEPSGKLKWHRGDACDVAVLAAAGVTMADVVASVTGDDEDNLVVSLLSKTRVWCASSYCPCE
jgi:trk system potassium uptake protein